MSSVGELRQELQKECLSRQRQEELNAKLQNEYDHLLKKLAVAELHIDRLRLGSSVDASKKFIITHNVEQHARLKEQLETQPDASTKAHVGSDSASEVRVISTGLLENGTDSDEPQSIEEVQVSVKSRSGGLDSHNASSIHSAAETDDFFQMSDTSIANWASVESAQMAHFFQAHNIQEQITTLKERINSGGVSVSEVTASLEKIQEEHRKLVTDIASSSTDLDALNKKYGGRVSRHIVHSQEAVGDELSSLAEQLKEIEELLRTKAQKLLHHSPPTSAMHMPSLPSATMSRRSDTSTADGKGQALADDSLDPPTLPSKYIDMHGDSHSPSTPPPISPQPSELHLTPSTAAGMEAQNTLSDFSDTLLSGDLSAQSSRLLHHQSSLPAPSDGSNGSPPPPAATSPDNSLLVENGVMSAPPSQQLSSTNPTITSSHPPLAHSSPPPPLPVVPHLQTTLSKNNSGMEDINLPPQSPPYHYPHLDPTHPKAPPTSSRYTNSDGPSPLLHDFESAPFLPHPSPREWASPGEADSGFAGSEVPQRKPESIHPPAVASSYQSVMESTEEEERGGEEDEEDSLPSLTTAAIDALRAELEDLKHQILNAPGLRSSSTPYQRSKHTRSPYPHSRRNTHKEPLVSVKTTTGLQTEGRHRDYSTLQTAFSGQTAPSTLNKATGTFGGGSVTWQPPMRSSHHGTQANHLLHSATPLFPLAHGRRLSTPMPSLCVASNTGRLNLEEDEIRQKPSLRHTPTNPKTGSSVCVSHSTETGHDCWVCSSCGGGGADGNANGVTSHLQGQKHGSKRKRDAQVTFVRQERGQIVEHKRYRMSEQKVLPYRTRHFPHSSDSDGDSDLENHHLGAEKYQPTSSHLIRESRFQPSLFLGQRSVVTSTPSILNSFQPSVLSGQRPVATSTPANLNKHRSTRYHEHFSPSIRSTEPHLSRRGTISSATPRRKWSSFRERVPHGRYSDVRHVVVPTEHESSSEDDQEAGHTSPAQYYVLKKPKREDYHTGTIATRTPRSNHLLHNSAPVQEEVYFSEPAVFGVERRRGEVVVMTPRPVEGVYLVEGGHGSIGDVKAVEATPLDLGDACRLARQLNRRSKRVHRTLQMELKSLY